MRTVLCVDDRNKRLEELSIILRDAGYRCLTATNCDKAERLFAANNVDLVILHDCEPGTNGESLGGHLRKIRAVKILMLTEKAEMTALSMSVDLQLMESALPNALMEAVASLTKVVDEKQRRIS